MKLDELLKLKLKRDLKVELSLAYKKNAVISAYYSESEFNEIIQVKLDKLKDMEITIDKTKAPNAAPEKYVTEYQGRGLPRETDYDFWSDGSKNKPTRSIPNQCCARAMGPRYSDIRCSSRASGSSEYCKTHLNRLNRVGYLRFGRYDEKRPEINERGNTIQWQDLTAMESINLVIQYQDTNICRLINKSN